MIYRYEAEVLRFINSLIPKIVLATYAKEEEMFNAMSSITKFPAFFYSRQSTDWQFNRVISERIGADKYSYVPFEQEYTGRILVENQSTAMKVANLLRFKWHDKPYLNIGWPTKEDKLSVGMRLLYIKIDEERYADDKKGAVRYVEFKWRSQLFQDRVSLDSAMLVESVQIHLNPSTDEVKIYNGDYLIKEL